jgi:molybdopterin-guanine dinucleotide biosynthesis protein B
MRIIILMLIIREKIAIAIARQGSRQVLVSSAYRSAHFIEHGERGEPDLSVLLDQLAPADLVLVEGFKSYPIEKIEVHRPSIGKPQLYPNDDLGDCLGK